MVFMRACRTSSTVLPVFLADPSRVALMRSVSNVPGSRLLMVTLADASLLVRATPATKPVRPLRAPLDRPRMSIGAFTELEVMLTMRPKPRAAMPSTVALISSMGVSMLASTALIQASRSQSRKSPGGGPPAFVTTMSKSLRKANTFARPSGVVMSTAIGSTCVPFGTPGSARKRSAAACKASAVRATMTTCAPSRASACAQPKPKPLLAPQTSAHLPVMPKFIQCPRVWNEPPMIRTVLLRALCVLALAAGLAPAAFAQEAAVTRRATELRDAPGDKGKSIAALPAQAAVTRTSERQGPWVQVRTDAGATGWVHLFDIGPAGTAKEGGSTAGNALRGVTGLFGGSRQTQTGSTAGIRGLDAQDLANAQPNPGAVTQMEALRQ